MVYILLARWCTITWLQVCAQPFCNGVCDYAQEQDVTFARTGCPSIENKRKRKNLMRRAAKRRTLTLKDLQEYLVTTGDFLHVATLSHMMHTSGVEQLRESPFSLKEMQALLHFAKACGKRCYGLRRPG